MATRKKSYKDIVEQAQRLYRMDRELNGGRYMTERQKRIQKISSRYLNNLVNNRGKKEELTTLMGNKYTRTTLKNSEKKYSRSAYMSSSNG